jgi:hypothetical protein
MFKEGLRAYPLSMIGDPPGPEFISVTGRVFNTIQANDVTFYDEIDAVIQREPIGIIDPETRGLIASIGIEKGKPFAPDDRMRQILIDGACDQLPQPRR